MLLRILENFDFSPNEQKILACLITGSSLSASVIAKRSGLKRPTCYLALEQLIESGFVTRKKRGGVAQFSMISQELLYTLLESRAQRRMENVIDGCQELRSFLANQQKSVAISGFEIETLRSYDAVYEQLFNVLTSGDYDAIFNPDIVCHTAASKKIMRSLLLTTSKSKPHIREIIVQGKEADWYKKNINNPNHVTKEISTSSKIMSDMILTDDFIIVSHYIPPDDLAIKIRHQAFLQTQKTLFEMVWQSL